MKRRAKLQNCILSHEGWAVLLLLALGLLLRFWGIGENPVGLNQDEASIGYEALSLLRDSVDRNGNSWPVLFVSWGSGQNVLYAYLTIPVFALFGPGVWQLRLVSVLCGSLTLPVFWALARRLRGKGFGLTALLFLAVNPWHIMLSRWALESNLLPFFLLLGIWCAVESLEHPRALLGAGAAFGLSLYAYGTAYIFLPPFLVLAVVYLAIKKKLRWETFLPTLAIFLLLAAPISVCNLINVLELGEVKLFGVITLPRLTETRQTATTVLGGGGLAAVGRNFKAFFSLLLTQSDGLIYNAYRPWGLYYVFGLPLILLGLGVALRDAYRRKSGGEALLLFALLSAVLGAGLIEVNVNRVNMAFLPLLYFGALGLHTLLRWLGDLGAAAVAGLLLCCALFVRSYCTDFRRDLSGWFFEGLGEAVVYAESLDPEQVYVSGTVNAPYIYVLFYNQVPAAEFYETVEYMNPGGAFQWVTGFGKYRFGGGLPSDAVCVLHLSELGQLPVLEYFGNYAVVQMP